MKTKNIIILFSIFVVAGLILGGYYWVNRPNQSMSSAKADLEVDAKAIYDEYVANETLAGAKYNDKVVLVSGMVSSVDKSNGQVAIMLDTGDPIGAVMCQLDAEINQESGELKEGDFVKFKGTCSGFMTDVQLQRCVLVK